MRVFNVSKDRYSLENHSFVVFGYHLIIQRNDGTQFSYNLQECAPSVRIHNGHFELGSCNWEESNFQVLLSPNGQDVRFYIDSESKAGIGIDDIRDAGFRTTFHFGLEHEVFELSANEQHLIIRVPGTRPLPGEWLGTWFQISKELLETPLSV